MTHIMALSQFATAKSRAISKRPIDAPLFIVFAAAHCASHSLHYTLFYTHKQVQICSFFPKRQINANLRSARLDGCKCFRYNIKCDNTNMLILGGS